MVLVVLLALRTSLSDGRVSVPSTYDTGAHGYAALYALLAREGVPVQRFELPPAQLFAHRGTLVIAGEEALLQAAPSRERMQALESWVRGGGTLVLLGSSPRKANGTLGLPPLTAVNAELSSGSCGLQPRNIVAAGTFTHGAPGGCTRTHATLLAVGRHAVALQYARGSGTVIFATTSTIFQNAYLSERDNAAFAYELFAGRGAVAFDERIYGHIAGRTFWQVLPLGMRFAVVIACVAVVAGIAGANLPFAPARAADEPEERDSSHYIASVARMLERGGTSREMIRRLCAHAFTVLEPRARADANAQRAAGTSSRAAGDLVTGFAGRSRRRPPVRARTQGVWMVTVSAAELATRIDAAMSEIIVGGKSTTFGLLLALFARGHALIEGVPGTGKTLAVRALASLIRAQYRRVQFTPDLLPADLIGTMVFNPQSAQFSLRPGPIVANVLLADEINRTPPKTQSALLEAMEEARVTIDGTPLRLPAPFFVCATQNPIEYEGTYPLPEAQLDRFLVRLESTYPGREAELQLLERVAQRLRGARDRTRGGTGGVRACRNFARASRSAARARVRRRAAVRDRSA